jgi:hypothetical protein
MLNVSTEGRCDDYVAMLPPFLNRRNPPLSGIYDSLRLYMIEPNQLGNILLISEQRLPRNSRYRPSGFPRLPTDETADMLCVQFER